MIQISIGRRRQLERTEADVVQSLVIDTEGLVGVLNYITVSTSRVNAIGLIRVPS